MSFSQPESATSQNGFGVVPCLFLAAVVFGLAFSAYDAFLETKKEVTADVYEQFSSIAAKSCSGTAYLKSLAAAGPILDGNAKMIERELQRLADAQQSANARAKITNSTVSCA